MKKKRPRPKSHRSGDDSITYLREKRSYRELETEELQLQKQRVEVDRTRAV